MRALAGDRGKALGPRHADVPGSLHTLALLR
jgi:hypothetical protein